MTPDAFVAELRAALALLNQGRAREARPRIERLIAARSEQPDPYALLGLALDQLGDAEGGAAQLRRAAALAPGNPQYPFELARLLARNGHPEAAVEAYRVHLRLAPANAAARHNLGAALLEAGEAGAAVEELTRAARGGHNTPETQLVLGRALEDLGRYDAAEAAYRAALAQRPLDAAAHRDLAQLIWRRTQDVQAASAALEPVLATPGAPADLVALRAKLSEYAGDRARALAVAEAALAKRQNEPLLLAIAAQLSLALDPDAALARAERAATAMPNDSGAAATLIQSQLATGQAEAAAKGARRLVARDPTDQLALALLSTAERLLGDRHYGELCDPALVRTYRLDPPAPWTDLGGYLSDLQAALLARHGLAGPPIGLSTRQGGEAALHPRHDRDPAIRAFFTAIRAPIAEHIAALGAGADPFRSRAKVDFRVAGAWSVRLRPHGFHANHVHPRGWISSAFYVALPATVGDGESDRAGWLKFGEPGPPTRPALAPDHFVKPEPGLLALFPSYFWHGTVPFGGAEPRLSIAFDVVPV